MFWLLLVESGEPVGAAGMDISAARVGWDCSFLPKHFRYCWASVFHTVPLNIRNSQTALKKIKGGKNPSSCFGTNLLLEC